MWAAIADSLDNFTSEIRIYPKQKIYDQYVILIVTYGAENSILKTKSAEMSK